MSTPLPRDEFPIVQRYVYLNHAAAGALPESSRLAVESFLAEHSNGGVLGTYPYDERLAEFRERIGHFIGASGEEIAIVASTSAGANAIAAGIDWQPGDGVLLCDDEFPSNAVPWIALRRRGVEVTLLPAAAGRLTPELLQRELRPRTRAVAVSWVTYDDGYRYDLAALAQAAHAGGALFCVDAIQGLGALSLDVRAAGIDALYAGAQKWLLGLHGSGVLFVARPVIERLVLAAPGWRSMQNIWNFSDYEQPYAPQALRFEGGTPNYIGALALACSAELFERSGKPAIEAHVLRLTDRLCEGLLQRGALLSTDRTPGARSGIVTFSMPGVPSVELGRALQRQGIVTTYRLTGIRVSPHGYNTESEVDQLLQAVEMLAA